MIQIAILLLAFVHVFGTIDSIEVVYQFPMIIGRSYNMGTGEVGVDLIKKSDAAGHIETENYAVSGYLINPSYHQINERFGLDPMLSLKIRAGVVDMTQIQHVFESIDIKENSLVLVVYKKLFKKSVTLREGVSATNACVRTEHEILGSHFVNRVSYGGMVVGVVRLYANNTSATKRISKLIDNRLDRYGSLEYLKKTWMSFKGDLSGISTILINVFSSPDIRQHPVSVEDLFDRIDEYSRGILTGEHSTVALSAQLMPIRVLSGCAHVPLWNINRDLVRQLPSFENQLMDIIRTRRTFNIWILNLPKDDRITEHHYIQIAKFEKFIDSALGVYLKIIGTLDMGNHTDKGQFDEARELYIKTTLKWQASSFDLIFEKLRLHVERGNWCNWSPWLSCEQKCGPEITIRTRKCACPTPLGGRTCVGNDKEQRNCRNPKCPEKMPNLVCETFREVNRFGGRLKFQCPHIGRISRIESYFDIHSFYRLTPFYDRRWTFECCHHPDQSEKLPMAMQVFNKINRFQNSFETQCTSGFYVTGLESRYDESWVDRVWSVTCMKTQAIKVYKDKCVWLKSGINTPGEQMNYRVPQNMIIAGLKTHYATFKSDRKWFVYLCPFKWIVD